MGASMSAEVPPVVSLATISSPYLRPIGAPEAGSRLKVVWSSTVWTVVERNFLEIGAVVAGGLEAFDGELGSDVSSGDLGSALARAAAFEEIVG